MAQRGRVKEERSDPELFRESLHRYRREILDLYEHDLRAGQSSNDEGTEDIVDRANNAYSRELMFQLTGAERDQLIQIEEAIRRLDDGSFGICSNCGETIGDRRLEALPWARYCIDCQERDERGLLDD